jgi:hypothetical protein
MTSLAELARRTLQRDPHLQIALAQDLLNARGLAKRIQESEGLDEGDVDSLANAIRRQRGELDPTTFEKNEKWLAATQVEAIEGLAALTLDRTPEVVQDVERFHRQIETERGETLEMLEDQASVTLLFDAARWDEATERFAGGAVRDSEENLTALELVPPDEQGASEAVLHAALGLLRARGFQIPFTLASSNRASLLVDGEDGREALELLDRMTEA